MAKKPKGNKGVARRQQGIANRGPAVPGAPESRFEVRQASFSGPLPPPHVLILYNDAVPSGADRVVTMAEENAAHRRSLEEKVVTGNIRAQARGQILGFILGMTMIVAGTGLIYAGHEAKGITMVLSTAVTMVGTFMWGRSRQEKERSEKARAFATPPQLPPS